MLLYDDVSTFLKAVQFYPSAALLVKEIYTDNKRLLTEKVENIMHEIIDYADLPDLNNPQIGSYLHILQAFTSLTPSAKGDFTNETSQEPKSKDFAFKV